jgi:hypothetical protein
MKAVPTSALKSCLTSLMEAGLILILDIFTGFNRQGLIGKKCRSFA